MVEAAEGAGDVLVGIIDVDGFDFAHPDFLAGGETRFVAIWDQGARHGPAPRFGYYPAEAGRWGWTFNDQDYVDIEL